MYRKIWGKSHPECEEGEFYIGNCTLRDFVEQFQNFPSARLGQIPYDVNQGLAMQGAPDYLKPLFLSESDYKTFLKMAEEIGPRIKAVELFTKGKGDKQ